jgi:acyl dehydratase
MATKELSSPPRLATLYPKALAGPALRLIPIGGPKRELPDTQLKVSGIEIDHGHLERYREVCGFASGAGTLPATYPHMLAFPLAMQLMTDRSFPFPAMGLVHIENRIEQLRPIGAEERLGVRVRKADLAEHERGTKFDIVAEASTGGQNVWRSRSTYLHREKRGGGKREGNSRRSTPPQPRAYWDVPDDIGRRYAAVSGDRNPIHLHPLTAKLFGFPRPIAHGMWLKARCLAEIESELPDAYTVSVQFKLPLLLPARVAFSASTEEFAVHDAASGKPHIAGSVNRRV